MSTEYDNLKRRVTLEKRFGPVQPRKPRRYGPKRAQLHTARKGRHLRVGKRRVR